MKPHIIKHMGIWHCSTACGGIYRLGIGYTPADAYADWVFA